MYQLTENDLLDLEIAHKGDPRVLAAVALLRDADKRLRAARRAAEGIARDEYLAEVECGDGSYRKRCVTEDDDFSRLRELLDEEVLS